MRGIRAAAGLAALLALGTAHAQTKAQAQPGAQLPAQTGPAPADLDRLRGDVERLVAFGTRHTLSDADHPVRGIGAARRWAAAEFRRIGEGCNGCLQVEAIGRRFEGPRAPAGVRVENVLAIQPGRRGLEHVVIVAAHIDSRVSDVMDATSDSPGANDDGSGSALVLEAARLLAGRPFEATIVYALLSGEEQGLWGGRLLAETARARGWKVAALLNNDIVGNTRGTDGRVVADRVRVFSEGIRASESLVEAQARRASGGEDDGPSRSLMRYVDALADRERDRIGLDVFGVRRPDRFGRGGDHLPALELGYPAIRFTVGVENYHHQHQDLRTERGVRYGDTVDAMDFAYLARVTDLNVAALAALAAAPPAPASATLGGAISSDTQVRWSAVDGAARYRVSWRPADARDWTESRLVEGTETVLAGVIVDDTLVGVSAIAPDGAESTTTFAGLPPR